MVDEAMSEDREVACESSRLELGCYVGKLVYGRLCVESRNIFFWWNTTYRYGTLCYVRHLSA